MPAQTNHKTIPDKKNKQIRTRNVRIVEVVFMSSEFGLSMVVGRRPGEVLSVVNALTRADPMTPTQLSRGIHGGNADHIRRDRFNRYWIRGYGIRSWDPTEYTLGLRQFHARRAIDAAKICAARQEALVTTLVMQREQQQREQQRQHERRAAALPMAGILASLRDQAVASTVRAL